MYFYNFVDSYDLLQTTDSKQTIVITSAGSASPASKPKISSENK